MTAFVRETMTSSPADAALERFFAAGARNLDTPEHRELWSALSAAASGGKRLRPAIFHSVYLALGGEQSAVAAEVAGAIELLHTALVIHDDVIDGDTVRRGSLNVSGTFADRARERGHGAARAVHYGDTAAILAGDLALTGAVRTLALCGAAPATVAHMLDLLDHALHLTAVGELIDVRLSMDGDADVTAAIAMEHQKTAVYSFELPLRLAAVLAGADSQYEPALATFARLLGVAYQLRDDLEGMFGDEERIGKSALSDLREGKCTPLIAHARTTDRWPQIHPHLAAEHIDHETAERVRLLLEQCGSRAYVEELASSLADQARQSVAHLPIAGLLHEWVWAVTADAQVLR